MEFHNTGMMQDTRALFNQKLIFFWFPILVNFRACYLRPPFLAYVHTIKCFAKFSPPFH